MEITIAATMYLMIGAWLAVYTARRMHRADTGYTNSTVGFAAIMTGALWPVETAVWICGLFARLTKSKDG